MRDKLTPKKRIQIMIVLMVMDFTSIVGSHFLALWIRYDFSFSEIKIRYIEYFASTIIVVALVYILVFALFKLYRGILTFAGVSDLFRIVIAFTVLAVISFVYIVIDGLKMPRSYYILGWCFSLICVVTTRFGRRILQSFVSRYRSPGRKEKVNNRIMIIGAGIAGHMILKDFLESDKLSGNKVVCFIDDNRAKKGCILEGVPIVGTRENIISAAIQYNVNKIIYAIPSSSGAQRKEILDICSKTGCSVEIVPGLYQFVDGQIKIDKLRKVEIQDLLGRDSVKVNEDDIRRYICGKTVLVTGGGGSIGSELCRQIAMSFPKTLIIFDIYENNAYEIQMELKRKYPELNLVVLIGSVRNRSRLDYVFKTYKPELVFHAAAHKHVPLMEDSPNEAIKNNVFGTYKTAQAAIKYGVKKFVLISTDKAVNPTNIMGASKRLCEMVVQMLSRQNTGTDFVAVRFGNVLGSNGSVIPLFEKQIAEGGPVTVTHPEITRFFMTIPEAVSLVLQAGFYANGGEIYVLDMGRPVKIADMAKNLIRLSGFEPDVDIRIEYTGLRPGEKLYEELLMSEEGLQETENKLIHIGKPILLDDDKFRHQLDELEEACNKEDYRIRDLVEKIVPTYKRTDII